MDEMNLQTHFSAMAAYNRWANEKLYRAVANVPDEVYRQDRGAFFGSLCGTLNHILVADLMWLHRLTGIGPLPSRLNEVLHEEFANLRRARETEDERIVAVVDGLGEGEWDRVLNYRRASGKAKPNPIREVLMHFFNHQTHHRCQAHCLLTGLGREGQSLI
jgi:uncharacterized damage-inducible protein DinB